MKEKIVLDFKDVKCAEDKNYVIAKKEKCKVEKYPTNWEELKELCKEEDISKCDDEIKIKWHNNTSLYFYEKDGEIICKDEDSCIEMIIGYDRTPAQMWQIIKSLTGDQK